MNNKYNYVGKKYYHDILLSENTPPLPEETKLLKNSSLSNPIAVDIKTRAYHRLNDGIWEIAD